VRSFAILACLVVATAAIPGAALAALTTSQIATDAELTSTLTNLACVAEGRGGDGAGAATFELDLGPDTAAPFVTAQYGWVNAQVEPFSLVYDSGLNKFTFTLGAKVLEYTPVPGFTEVWVRTRAVNAGSTCLVSNMVLDAENVGDTSFADGDATGLGILRIQGGTLNDGFVLTGEATLSWTGSLPSQSRLAFQIKIGTPDSATPVDASTWGRVKALYR
jgi:hypothetical protein